jgi:hypothetical protein
VKVIDERLPRGGALRPAAAADRGGTSENFYYLFFARKNISEYKGFHHVYPEYAAGPSVFGFTLFSDIERQAPPSGTCGYGPLQIKRGPARPIFEMRRACIVRYIVLTKRPY